MGVSPTGVRVTGRRRRSGFRDPQIEMAHGAGGKASRRLIEGLIAPLLWRAAVEPLGDAAIVDVDGVRLAVTSDSFVVTPLRFPAARSASSR